MASNPVDDVASEPAGLSTRMAPSNGQGQTASGAVVDGARRNTRRCTARGVPAIRARRRRYAAAELLRHGIDVDGLALRSEAQAECLPRLLEDGDDRLIARMVDETALLPSAPART
jgi:hypothetical protein